MNILMDFIAIFYNDREKWINTNYQFEKIVGLNYRVPFLGQRQTVHIQIHGIWSGSTMYAYSNFYQKYNKNEKVHHP